MEINVSVAAAAKPIHISQTRWHEGEGQHNSDKTSAAKKTTFSTESTKRHEVIQKTVNKELFNRFQGLRLTF